jgi:prepilin-type N-terminal cleavage/methylation domain-containing protein
MPANRRSGFTLIELLVVISIIAFLAALVIAFFPSINAQTAEAQGAVNLQGYLTGARQKAIRNQNPVGLRFWMKNVVDNTQPFFRQVTECQYIEQPDDYVAPDNSTMLMSTLDPALFGLPPAVWTNRIVAISGIDVSNGTYNPAPGFYLANPQLYDQKLFDVQSGDNLEAFRSGLMHSIMTQWPASGQPPIQVAAGNISVFFLNTALPFPIPATASTSNYRIMRQPRVLGDETLPFPNQVVVDINVNLNNIDPAKGNNNVNYPPVMDSRYVNPLPITYIFPPGNPVPSGGYVDVLFSPSGTVLSSTRVDTMNFWVRRVDSSNPRHVLAGQPTVIAVFVRTGFVGAYAPLPVLASPVPPAPPWDPLTWPPPTWNPYADIF